MADSALAIASVATGTGNVQGNIDVAQVTQTDQFGNPIVNQVTQTTSLLRENVVLADPINFFGQAQVTSARGAQVDTQMIDLLQAILIELRGIATILADGLNLRYDLDQLRNDNSLMYEIEQ